MAAACRASGLAWVLSGLGRLDLEIKLKYPIRSLLRLGFQQSVDDVNAHQEVPPFSSLRVYPASENQMSGYLNLGGMN